MNATHLINLPVELLRGIFKQTLEIKDVIRLTDAATNCGELHHAILLALQNCALSEISLSCPLDVLVLSRCLQWKLGAQNLHFSYRNTQQFNDLLLQFIEQQGGRIRSLTPKKGTETDVKEWKSVLRCIAQHCGNISTLTIDTFNLCGDMYALINSFTRLHTVNFYGPPIWATRLSAIAQSDEIDDVLCNSVRVVTTFFNPPLLSKLLTKFPRLEKCRLLGLEDFRGETTLACVLTRCAQYELIMCWPIAATFEDHLRCMPNLHTIKVLGCKMDISHVRLMCKHCRNLEHVHVGQNKQIDDDCMRFICENFSGTLKTLCFADTSVTSSGIENVCLSCPNLQKLSIDGLVLTSACVRIICHTLQLHTLTMRECSGYNALDEELLRARNFSALEITHIELR